MKMICSAPADTASARDSAPGEQARREPVHLASVLGTERELHRHARHQARRAQRSHQRVEQERVAVFDEVDGLGASPLPRSGTKRT